MTMNTLPPVDHPGWADLAAAVHDTEALTAPQAEALTLLDIDPRGLGVTACRTSAHERSAPGIHRDVAARLVERGLATWVHAPGGAAGPNGVIQITAAGRDALRREVAA